MSKPHPEVGEDIVRKIVLTLISITLGNVCLSGVCLCALGDEPMPPTPPMSSAEQRLAALEQEVANLKGELAKKPAPAWTEATPMAPPVCTTCQPADSKKYPTVQLTGFFHLDTAWFGQDPNNIATVGDIQDGVDFRRVRLGAKGNVADWISYMVEMDFAASQPLFVDNWVNFSDLEHFQNIRLGRWRQPFGMSELTGIRELPFMERPLTFCMAPFRQTGIGFYGHDDDELMTWAGSIIRGPSDNFGNNAGDNGGWGYVTRGTILPYYDEEREMLFHLGAGYYFLDPSMDTIRIATTPEIQLVDSVGGFLPTPQLSVPPFVDTGTVPTDNLNGIDIEAAGRIGDLVIQSEARWLVIDQIGGPTETIFGTYAYFRYMLTDDNLPYNRTQGVFGRINPSDPVLPGHCGIGAWEVCGRLSHIDANGNWQAIAPAAPGAGRRLTDVTLGLNWYLNRYAKMQFNYIHAFLDDPTLGSSDADIVALRCQLDF